MMISDFRFKILNIVKKCQYLTLFIIFWQGC